MALVDANYKFIYVDVGAAGRAGDASVFANSVLKTAIDNNYLDLPEASALQGMSTEILHHMVGDDAFPLNTQLMKPYPYRNLDKEQRIFNYRLSTAHRVVENAFGILAHRWRVFLTAIKLSPERVSDMIFAACCLHNYMIEKNKASYISAVDQESAGHILMQGAWRNNCLLNSMKPTTTHDAPKDAKLQRQILTTYFNTHGRVPWQNTIVK